MTQTEYDYRGLVAATWDLWRSDTAAWSDRQLYLDLVRDFGEPVLDVGCGTGRIVLDFVAVGIDCDGVDNSPEMLAICRKKAKVQGLATNLYQQRMQELDLPRRYRTILVPSSSLQLITDTEEAGETVRHLHAHLLPGGALVAPFSFAPAPVERRPADEWALVFEKVRPEDGALVRRWSRERYHVGEQLWDAEDRFEVSLDGVAIMTEEYRRCPEGRWYTRRQAADLFRCAGFIDVRLLRGFTRGPAGEGDPVFTVVAVKS
jgi:ubiquinone/menaquinone biosynthesis C-methylase UbiE